MKKAFVAVIGKGNSGKSTVISCLTGCRSHGARGPVKDNATNRWIWVSATSPQEISLSRAAFKREVVAAANDPLCIGIVSAIQPTNPSKKLSLEDIYTEVDLTGAFKNFAFIIDPAYEATGGNVALVRARILNISSSTTVRTLDARKFGFLNAEYIQKISAIPW